MKTAIFGCPSNLFSRLSWNRLDSEALAQQQSFLKNDLFRFRFLCFFFLSSFDFLFPCSASGLTFGLRVPNSTQGAHKPAIISLAALLIEDC